MKMTPPMRPMPQKKQSTSPRIPRVRAHRTQRRGGKGLRDIKTSERNGAVVDVVPVTDADEILVMTKGGKLQQLRADGISVIGRNTQGVRIMGMDEGDTVIAVVCVPVDPNPPVAE